jgi:hypothetical protein
MEDKRFESLYPDTTREKEIEKVLTFIKKGESVQLVSIPGVGRSNFLVLLAYNKTIRQKHLGEEQKDYHFVYLDFSEIRKGTISDVFKFIFIGVLDSLKDRGFVKRYESVNKIFRESVSLKDEMVMFSGLKKAIDFLCLEKELTVVLLFDRFEEYVPSVTSEFFANLKILRNRAKYKFSVVFSLNRPLEETFEPIFFSDFYEIVAGKVVILPISDLAGTDFRISYLEKITNRKIERNLLNLILELSGGHTNLVRLCSESLLASDRRLQTKAEIRKYFLTQKSIRSALFAIWNYLTPEEKRHLLGRGFKDLEFLGKIGLISDGEITIPLFADYMQEKASDVKEEKIDIGSIADKLTVLEFKLLKFLMETPDRVVEKEEIINEVWGEQKTVLGVTDQALDQLIFRLRKKIETNPTSPAHIKTIKGRGFKFSL